MEIISFIGVSDGYTHYIFNNALGIPFEFRVLLIGGGISLIYLVLKKLIG